MCVASAEASNPCAGPQGNQSDSGSPQILSKEDWLLTLDQVASVVFSVTWRTVWHVASSDSCVLCQSAAAWESIECEPSGLQEGHAAVFSRVAIAMEVRPRELYLGQKRA